MIWHHGNGKSTIWNHLQRKALEESTISNQPSLFTKSTWNDTFQRIGSKFKMNLFLTQILHPLLQPTLKLFSLYVHGPSLFYTRLTSMMLEGLAKVVTLTTSFWKNNVLQISAFNICKHNIYSPARFGPDFYRGFHLNKSWSHWTSWSLGIHLQFFQLRSVLNKWHGPPARLYPPKGHWKGVRVSRSADLPGIILCWQPSITVNVLNVAHCNANRKTWAI